MKPIGINNFVIFGIDARVDSSFDSVFDNNQQLNVSDGLAGDIRRATIGDITELYPILKTEISNLETSDIQAIAKVVYKIVTQYFGDFSNIKYRLTNYPSEDSITNDSELGVISDLKGKNAAMCVERAAVSQNLLQLIGIKSIYKASIISNDGKPEGHAYNLIEYDGHYYIFDATMPSEIDREITPIICEIPKEVFEEISSPLHSKGCKVKVTYFNPVIQKQKTIIYDSAAKMSYIVTDDINQKKL